MQINIKKEGLQMTPEMQAVSDASQAKRVSALADVIWHECYRELLSTAQINYMLDKFLAEQVILDQIAQEGYNYYLVRKDDRDIGFLALRADADKRVFLSKIYLLQSERGQGYAQQLLAYSSQYAKDKGCNKIWLTVNRDNARAVAAYKKQGFQVLYTQDVDIGGGYLMEDYVLEWALPNAQAL